MEILELNDDGTFDIPSPTRKPAPSSRYNDDVELIEPRPEDVERVTAETLGTNALEKMSTGEYKVYQNAKSVTLLIKIDSSERPESVSLDASFHVHVNTSHKHAYSVELPDTLKYNRSGISARFSGDAVAVTVDLLV